MEISKERLTHLKQLETESIHTESEEPMVYIKVNLLNLWFTAR